MCRINYLLASLLVCYSGCLQNQVRDKSLGLAATTSDLLYMQILDNVALNIDNPAAIPYFDMPASGTMQIQQSLSATSTSGWSLITATTGLFGGRFPFTSQVAAVNPSQSDQESWQMSPTADPDRLILMQAAYRMVTGNGTPDGHRVIEEYYSARDKWVEINVLQDEFGFEMQTVVDGMLKRMMAINAQCKVDCCSLPKDCTPDGNGKTEAQDDLGAVLQKDTCFSRLKTLYNFGSNYETHNATLRAFALGAGGGGGGSGGGGGGAAGGKPPLPIHVDYRSFIQPGWFCYGKKRDVPKDACYVGHHGGTYVWVNRDHLDELSKFSLAILDFYNLGNTGGTIPAAPPATIK